MKPSDTRSSHRPLIQVAMELAGVVNVGGVGDVVRQVATAAASAGYPTTIVLPWFTRLDLNDSFIARHTRTTLQVAIDLPYFKGQTRPPELARLHLLTYDVGSARLDLCLIEADRFRGKERPYTYTEAEAQRFASLAPEEPFFCGTERPPVDAVQAGLQHYDYAAMNVLLQKVALELALVTDLTDPIFHLHDGQAAALAMIARCNQRYASLRDSTFVVTVHNCGHAYRQRCPDARFVAAASGVPVEVVLDCILDGAFDPVAAGAVFGDATVTVSDGYAWEVETAERHGSGGDADVRGLSRFLRERGLRLPGISNGVDPGLKGPEALPEELRPTEPGFGWKQSFKAGFLRRIENASAHWKGVVRLGNLDELTASDCLITFVGRLTEQKSPAVLIRAVEEVLAVRRGGVGVLILGDSDDPRTLEDLGRLVRQFSGKVTVFRGFNAALAAEVFAAGDYLIVPSAYEPCNLTDLQAQLNGTIPVVNQVGGLAKVIDGHTGLGYFALDARSNLRGLVASMHRAARLFADRPALEQMQAVAAAHVRANYTWNEVFPRYQALYDAR